LLSIKPLSAHEGGITHLKRNYKKVFFTGLAVLMPVGLTLYILAFLIGMMDSLLLIIPEKYQPDAFLPFHIPGLGVIVTVILIFACGFITQSYIGNKIVNISEGLFAKIPFVRSIYQAMKQISDSMFMDKSQSFKKVVLIRFPSENVYSVAFITGVPNGEFKEKIKGQGRNYVGVFMPTAPNPTTGLYMMMPEDELIYLDISVEKAFTLIISAGIVTPASRQDKKT
jgi:uncharacterized membrane protein